MRAIGILGAAVGTVGLYGSAGVVGGLAWSASILAACVGHGAWFAFVSRQRASLALLGAIGLAIVLSVSTVLARVGVLVRDAQVVMIAVGWISAAVVPYRSEPRSMSPAILAIAMCIGTIVITIAVTTESLVIGDGANHGFSIKQLWDIGTLALHHQAGAQVIGESYSALATGAHIASVFESGVCVALLLALLASELATRGRALGVAVFLVLAVGLLLHPAAARDEVVTWSAVLFVAAAWVSLHRALEAGQLAWLVVPAALALLALRHEYVPLALPFLAAVVLPREQRMPRWTIGAMAAAWCGVLFAMQLGYRASPITALWRVVLILFAAPLARVGVAALGATTWRSAAGVGLFAALSLTIASGVHAISPSFQAPNTLALAWLATGLGFVLVACARESQETDPASSREPITLALVLAMIVGVTLLDGIVSDAGRRRVLMRITPAAERLDELRTLGFATEPHDEALALQQLVPPGVRMGFWGASAARLDFRRNPIRDVSWPSHQWRSEYFLSAIDRRELRGVDYVLVETMFGRPVPDPWGTWRATATSAVADDLLLIASLGRMRLFRVNP